MQSRAVRFTNLLAMACFAQRLARTVNDGLVRQIYTSTMKKMGQETNKPILFVTGWKILLAELEISLEDVSRHAGLSISLLGGDSPFLSVDQYFAFWRAFEKVANERFGEPFPLLIANSLKSEGFHPVIFAALCSDNLVGAAARIAKHKRLVAPMTVEREELPDGFFVGCRWNDESLEVPDSHSALELAFNVQIARLGTRRNVVPCRVECPFELEPLGAYEEFFGIRPIVSNRVGVTFSREDAHRPFVTANSIVQNLFTGLFQQSGFANLGSGTESELVRSAVISCLSAGEVSIDIVSQRLGMSRRTLQRRLAEEGKTFQTVLEDVRSDLAARYLLETNLPYSEIAFLLGYEEHGSFARAFKKWTGFTPGEYRSSGGD